MFNSLVGQMVLFFGVDNNVLCVKPIGAPKQLAFEVVEDEDDGYRSAMDELRPVPVEGHTFFRQPITSVLVEKVHLKGGFADESFDGYRLVDENGHVWLRFGTENFDDYYPMFIFEYTPKRG